MTWFNIFERCPSCGEYLWYELGYDSPRHYAIASYYMYSTLRYEIEYDIIEVSSIEDI